MASVRDAPAGVLAARDTPSFDVHLDCFTGPFDLLLALIAKHRLDITEVALAEVTDEFVAHVRRLSAQARDAAAASDALGQLSAFLVVAATLLDLKAARLLPAGEVEDEDDLALLEARDLLFARLLQHRAYVDVGALLASLMAHEALLVPRAPTPPPVTTPAPAAPALPPLLWTTTPGQLAAMASAALEPKPVVRPRVATEHLHAPAVSIPEQVAALSARLAAHGVLTFDALIADAGGTPVVVGRFLAVLEMYRRGWVDLAQEVALGPLQVRWAGPGPAS